MLHAVHGEDAEGCVLLIHLHFIFGRAKRGELMQMTGQVIDYLFRKQGLLITRRRWRLS